MKRTTVTLPDDLHSRVEREAKRNGVSASEVVRNALAEHFGTNGRKKELSFAAIGRSGTTEDAAAKADEILAREWTRDRLFYGGP